MAPRPPRGLDAAGRAAWRRAARVLELSGEDVELSVEPLAAYARASSDAARLRRALAADGRLFIAGPRGGTAPHPLVRAVERAERWAHELGASLGLDPASRRRMRRGVGRPAGSASAPDRRGGTVVPLPPRRKVRRPDA